jgi:excisionase family DNA binding protein
MNVPLAYTIAEACAAARAGRTAIYAAIREGVLTARKRGRKTLILVEDLRRWVENLPTVEPKAAAFPHPRSPSGVADDALKRSNPVGGARRHVPRRGSDLNNVA